MYNNEQKNEENFWISYADLMAGLLFVFILVIGAIVIKYLYTQNNLEREKQALNLSQEEILNKNSALKKIQDEKAQLFYELAQARNIYEETKTKLDSANVSLDEKAKSISLNLAEIEKWIKRNTQEYDEVTLIGSGGNINKLFKMSGKMQEKPLSYIYVNSQYAFLNSLSYEQRIAELALNPDRADVIIPATRIYLNAMKWSGARNIYVPKIGLSDGIVKAMYYNKI